MTFDVNDSNHFFSLLRMSLKSMQINKYNVMSMCHLHNSYYSLIISEEIKKQEIKVILLDLKQLKGRVCNNRSTKILSYTFIISKMTKYTAGIWLSNYFFINQFGRKRDLQLQSRNGTKKRKNTKINRSNISKGNSLLYKHKFYQYCGDSPCTVMNVYISSIMITF